jgi:hypothetical protein
MRLDPDTLADITDSDMQAFIGPGWETAYADYWGYLRHRRKGSLVLFRKTNWLGLLCPPVWFLYRKMVLHAALFCLLVFGAEAVLAHLHVPTGGLIYAFATLSASRYLYFLHAVKKIRAIRRTTVNAEFAEGEIRASGGVSSPAMLLGLAVFFGFTWFYVNAAVRQVETSMKASGLDTLDLQNLDMEKLQTLDLEKLDSLDLNELLNPPPQP